MNLLPKASGTRPRLACEIFAGGVVAGRSPEPGLPLAAVARVELPREAVMPSVKPGNLVDRVAVVAALRRVLEQVGGRGNGRNAELTLIIPDGAVRVSLLDFDALPTKLSEALPIVRFRLKKLVPFDADHAMISFQVMSTSRSVVRVLAIAIPRDVLSEYESAVREAGFEPGAVLPSTLASLAALDEGEGAAVVVNAHVQGVTTAIVRAGIVLLHRAVDLAEFSPPTPANLPPALFERAEGGSPLDLVDRESTAAEWAAQEATPEFGYDAYADRLSTEAATQNQDAVPAGLAMPYTFSAGSAQGSGGQRSGDNRLDLYAEEAAPPNRSPYASPTLQQELSSQFLEPGQASPDPYRPEPRLPLRRSYDDETEAVEEPTVHLLSADVQADEIARAVSVTMAYFEDSLAALPEVLLSAGPFGAEALGRVLREQGIATEDGVRVRELVEAAALASTATTAAVPRAWLAGVTGALRS